VSGTKDWKTRDEALTLMVRIEDRLIKLPKKTMLGLLRGFDKAIAVAEKHDVDKGSAWLNQEPVVHAEHAYEHLEQALYEENSVIDVQALDDDGLPHIDHGACRLLLAIAKREGM
jgi:hypothetical protein